MPRVAFCNFREQVRSFDKNDDELRKSVASRAYLDGGYPFDVI